MDEDLVPKDMIYFIRTNHTVLSIPVFTRKAGTRYSNTMAANKVKHQWKRGQKGVIYGVLDKDGNLAYIVFFDENNMRSRQIDVKHYHTINGVPERPHVHIGYEHNEGGDTIPSTEEQRIIKEVSELVEKVKRKNHVR